MASVSSAAATGAFSDITRDLFSNAKVIGRIPVGGKISLRGKFLHISDPWAFDYLVRWFYGDSRERTLSFIKEVLGDLMRLHENLCYQEKGFVCSEIEQDVRGCRHGLCNLKETYVNDFQTVAQLDGLISATEHFLTSTGSMGAAIPEQQ